MLTSRYVYYTSTSFASVRFPSTIVGKFSDFYRLEIISLHPLDYISAVGTLATEIQRPIHVCANRPGRIPLGGRKIRV